MKQTFKISAKEIKKADGSGTFVSCSAKINNIWYKVKFTKESTVSIKTRGLYDITVRVDDMSRQKGREKVNKNGKKVKENDTIWINNVVTLRKYTKEEMDEINRNDLAEVFGGYVELEDDEELPM